MGDADNSTRPPGKTEGGEVPPPAAAPETPPEEDQTKKLKLNGDAVVEEAAAPLVVSSTPSTDATMMEGDEPNKDDCNNKEVKEDPPEKKEEVKEEEPPPPPLPEIKVTVMYNKNPLSLEISPSCTVLELKKRIQTHTSVDPSLQKVLLKGIAKDDAKLVDLGVSAATKKILVIGSSIQEVLAVKEVPSESVGGGGGGSGTQADSSSNWCSVQAHKKVIDKGLPDDVMPGILDEHDPLPPFPLHGMYSSKGSKVRLTFKLENDELWIGTKERTEKVPIGTIRNVTSQPITGYEHYHIVAIQLGPTEASRFFVYWVPAQYVEAIKDALTGA